LITSQTGLCDAHRFAAYSVTITRRRILPGAFGATYAKLWTSGGGRSIPTAEFSLRAELIIGLADFSTPRAPQHLDRLCDDTGAEQTADA
jgi:hypothetical protein